MKTGSIYQFGLGLLAGAALAVCTSCSTAGWGPPPPAPAAPVSAQQGAPRFAKTTGMRLTAQQQAVKVPANIRVQDCSVVVVSSPARYVCPDGKVYTTFELARAREQRQKQTKMASASAPAATTPGTASATR